MPTSEMDPWTFSICTLEGKGLRAMVQPMGRLEGSCGGGEERRKTGGGAGNEERWAVIVALVLMATIVEIYLAVQR